MKGPRNIPDPPVSGAQGGVMGKKRIDEKLYMSELDIEKKRAYARGYNAGSRWPDHRPPIPPNDIFKDFVERVYTLRDEVDRLLSSLDEDDPIWDGLRDCVDSVDEGFKNIGKWLKSDSQEGDMSKKEIKKLLEEGSEE